MTDERQVRSLEEEVVLTLFAIAAQTNPDAGTEEAVNNCDPQRLYHDMATRLDRIATLIDDIMQLIHQKVEEAEKKPDENPEGA